MWLLEATGDPHRNIRIDFNPETGADVIRPASTFHFPACSECNKSYGERLEADARATVLGLSASGQLTVTQCYVLLDWLDKVRIGLWLGYHALHRDEFEPKFRIDSRMGTKDRVAIVSVDAWDASKVLSFGGFDNNIFRTSQAGIYLRINNIRILSISTDSLVSELAGLPYAAEMMIMAEPPHRNVMTLRKNDFKLRHDWPDFDGLRGTILAQAIFSPAELSISSAKSYYFDRSMISHLRGAVPKQLSKKDLARTFQTQLISNAHNSFRYFPKDQRRISFSKAAKNTDVDFMRELYGIYLRRVLPLHPKMMITSSGETSSPVFLAQRWIENALQIFFRLEKLGLPASSVIDELVDELQRVTRAREESSANIAGTCEPESSKLLYIP